MNDGLSIIVAKIRSQLASLDQTRGKLEAALKLLTDDKAVKPKQTRARKGNGVVNQTTEADNTRASFPS